MLAAVLLSGCTSPTLDLEPLTNSQLQALSLAALAGSTDGLDAVARVERLRELDGSCPAIITDPGSQRIRLVGTCTNSIGLRIEGAVDVDLSLTGSSKYAFHSFRVSDAVTASYDGTVSIAANGPQVNLTTGRTDETTRSELSVDCTAGKCNVDGSVELIGDGDADVSGTLSSGGGGSLTIRGADTDPHTRHDDNVLRVALEPGCWSWRLSTTDWFEGVRTGSSC